MVYVDGNGNYDVIGDSDDGDDNDDDDDEYGGISTTIHFLQHWLSVNSYCQWEKKTSLWYLMIQVVLYLLVA